MATEAVLEGRYLDGRAASSEVVYDGPDVRRVVR